MTHHEISHGIPNNSMLVSGPVRGRHLFVFVLISAAVIALVFLLWGFVENSMLRNCMALAIYVSFGAFNHLYPKKTIPGSPFINRMQLMIVQSLLFTLLIILASFCFFHFELLMTTACVAAFVLPACIDEAWQAFSGMPGVAVIVWHPADEEQQLPKRIQYKKDLSVQFVLRKKAGGSVPATIMHQASKHDILGHSFNQLTSYRMPGVENEVELNDTEGTEFDWAFYSPHLLLGKRWLDPYATIRQNKIEKEIRVFVKRIKTSDI